MSNVCKCGKGYGSEFDWLCKHCREAKYCATRRECSLMGIKRGEGLTLHQIEKVIAVPAARYHYESRGGKCVN